jgi:hypothetical protein
LIRNGGSAVEIVRDFDRDLHDRPDIKPQKPDSLFARSNSGDLMRLVLNCR